MNGKYLNQTQKNLPKLIWENIINNIDNSSNVDFDKPNNVYFKKIDNSFDKMTYANEKSFYHNITNEIFKR